MNEYVTLFEAAKIMGDNFIGPSELASIGIMKLSIPSRIPHIPFTLEELDKKKNDYLLILGISESTDGSVLTIRNLIKKFGKDPNETEPCFYNQDLYEK